jgi:hypothetical protein
MRTEREKATCELGEGLFPAYCAAWRLTPSLLSSLEPLLLFLIPLYRILFLLGLFVPLGLLDRLARAGNDYRDAHRKGEGNM